MYTVYLLSLLYQGTPGKSVWAGKPVGKTGSRADATSGHRQRLGETPNVAWEGKRANGKSSFLSWAKHSTPLLTGQEKRADDSSLPSHSCGDHPATRFQPIKTSIYASVLQEVDGFWTSQSRPSGRAGQHVRRRAFFVSLAHTVFRHRVSFVVMRGGSEEEEEEEGKLSTNAARREPSRRVNYAEEQFPYPPRHMNFY